MGWGGVFPFLCPDSWQLIDRWQLISVDYVSTGRVVSPFIISPVNCCDGCRWPWSRGSYFLFFCGQTVDCVIGVDHVEAGGVESPFLCRDICCDGYWRYGSRRSCVHFSVSKHLIVVIYVDRCGRRGSLSYLLELSLPFVWWPARQMSNSWNDGLIQCFSADEREI